MESDNANRRRAGQDDHIDAPVRVMVNELLENPLFAECAPRRTLLTKPMGFIDVGAREGVHEVVEPLARATAVLAFEPDVEESQRLRDQLSESSPWAKYRIEPIALADVEGNARLHLLSWSHNNSLRAPNKALAERYDMKKFEERTDIPVRTSTLDNAVFQDPNENWGEFLKLDTQGTEFEILQGAERTLSERTVAILTEVEFAELYNGQKLFSETELFLRERGFSFYGFTSMHYRSQKRLDKRVEAGRERAFHADAVFFKDPLGNRHQPSLPERGNHLLFLCAVLLRFYDFAIELALRTWATGAEADRIETLVRTLATLPPDRTFGQAQSLVEAIRRKPELANIIMGHFVDERRNLYDYQDTPDV